MNNFLTAIALLVCILLFRGEPSIAELIRQHVQVRVQIYAETHPVADDDNPPIDKQEKPDGE